MEQTLLTALVLVIILALALLGVLIVLIVKKRSVGGTSDSAVKTEGERTRDEVKARTEAMMQGISLTTDSLRQGVTDSNRQMLDHLKTVAENSDKRQAELRDTLDKSLTELKEKVNAELMKVREDNERQLDKMRGVVDEKLTKTLDERLTQSFGAINERLENVYKNLGEIQQLSGGMTDLRRMLSNIKTRGTYGETNLETLLEETLPGAYEKQFVVGGRGASERVDFAVVLPGQSDDRVYLPIDVKFPLEDYNRLQSAAETANEVELKAATKGLEEALRTEARSIRDKYIKVPKTTNFAIMFLPTEGLYAEVLKREKLMQELYRMNVLPAGPTSIMALLNSLQMGFRSVQIQKESMQVFKTFTEIQKYLGNFNKLLAEARDSLIKVDAKLGKVSEQSQKISGKLAKIELPEGTDANQEADGGSEDCLM